MRQRVKERPVFTELPDIPIGVEQLKKKKKKRNE